MNAVSIRTAAVVAIFFLTNYSVCNAAESRAKQVLTSFVSCQVSNAALEKAGITIATLRDANSNEAVAAKVLSLLSDKNAAKLLANPKMLTMDGEAGRIELANESAKILKIDLTASIQEKSLIIAKIDWQKFDSNGPGVESLKTRVQLHSGKPSILSSQRLNDQTLFLIVTSEILDPNKPTANSVGTGQKK